MLTQNLESVSEQKLSHETSHTPRSPLRIVLYYLIVGTIWILLGDHLVDAFVASSWKARESVELAKGLAYVILSGVLLYLLIARHHRTMVANNQRLATLVSERTRDLRHSNQNLEGSNEKLRLANEELLLANEHLQQASRKIQAQAEVILRQKDEQLNRVLDNSQDAIFSIDLSGRGEHYLSRSCSRIFGEAVHQHVIDKDFWMDRTHPDDRGIRLEGRKQLADTGVAEIVTRMRSDEGDYHWIYERHHLVNENGVAIRQEGLASDISRLKHAEMELRDERNLLRSIIDHLPDNIYVKDRNLRHILNNQASVELLRVQHESAATGKTITDLLGDDALRYEQDDRQVVTTGQSITNKEERIMLADDREHVLLTTKVPWLDANGDIRGLVGISRDVTDFRQNERLLHQYRENLDIVFSNTNESILLVDQEGKIVLFNQVLETTIMGMIGRKPKIGEYLWDITVKERRETSRALFAKTLQGEFSTIIGDVPGFDGRIKLEVRYNPVRLDGQVKYVVIVTRDITHQYQQEQEVQQYREKLEVLFSNTTDGILLLDPVGTIEVINTSMVNFVKSLVGKIPEKGNRFLDLATPEQKQLYEPLLERALSGEVVRFDLPAILAEGKEAVIDVRYSPIRLDGQIRYVLCLATDVTEARRQQQVIRDFQSKLEVILSNTVEGILMMDREGKVLFLNRSHEEFIRRATGTTPQAGQFLWDVTLPERREIARELFGRTVAGEALVIDAPFHVNEETLIHELRYSPVWMDGQVSFVTITSVDVTQRRLQELRLKESEMNLRAIFENTNDLFALLDENGKVLAFNKAYADNVMALLGRPTAIGDSILGYTDRHRTHEFAELMRRVKSGEIVTYQRNISSTQEPVWFQIVVGPVSAEDGKLKGYCFSATNITEIQRARFELKASEERFRSLVENSEDVFLIVGAEMKLDYVSPNLNKVLGYSTLECQQRSLLEMVVPEDRATARHCCHYMSTGDVGSHQSVLLRMTHADRSVRWMEGTAINLIDTPGILGRVLVLHDVTGVKTREAQVTALKDSLQDFQQAIYRSSIVSISDPSGRITFVNDNFIQVSGFSREELIGDTHQKLNSGFHPSAFWDDMWRTITKGNAWKGEVKNRAKDGTFYWVDTFIMPFLHENGTVKEYLTIRTDITDRKKVELDLLQTNFLLDKANEVARIGHWTYYGVPGKFHWNRKAVEILGIDPQRASGDREYYLLRVHPDDRAEVRRAFQSRFNGGFEATNHRIILPDGSTRWIHEQANLFLDGVSGRQILIGIVQDISDQKTTEQILREYNERYDILSKATNDAVWDWDMVNDFETWNHGLKSIFGYPEEIIREPRAWWREKIHPDDYERVEQTAEFAFRSLQTHWNASYRYLCADGNYKFVFDRAYIVYMNEKPVRMIGAMQDVTAQVNAVREIEKLSLVASKTSNSVIITDAEDRIEWVNDAFTRQTGYSLSEVWGKMPESFLVGPETDLDTLARIHEAMHQRESITEELINYGKDGRKFWLRTNITPVINQSDALEHFIAVQSDISEQVEYEHRITTIAREMSSLIESASVPIFGIDRNGYVNEWNKAAVQLTEYKRNEVLGRKWGELVTAELSESVETALHKALSGEPAGNYEFPFESKSGSHLIFMVTLSPRRDINNQIIGALCIAQDVTEVYRYRKGLERIVEARTAELNKALMKEKELVDMKSKFVSIASHEFRTPLTTISIASGFIKKYKDKLSETEMDKKLDNIEKQVRHMTYLLDDVLTIGKAEAGKINVQRTSMQLRDWLDRIVMEVYQSTGRSHSIKVNWNTDLVWFEGDEKLMRNIFINLLTNAIKFSPQAVLVLLDLDRIGSSLQIRITDYGIGIPDEDKEKLFDAFHRGSNISTIQGTGLGMSITKKAVELMGGTIVVDTRLGEGSSFTVTLPIVTTAVSHV